MEKLERKIAITPEQEVSSIWRVPDNYQGADKTALIVAHGAGNDMHSDFIQDICERFTEKNILTISFNFIYKELGKKPPDRAPKLELCWNQVINAVRNDSELAPARLFISGKSMGGRMATHIAAQGTHCDGIILFGYPLHPPGKPEKMRKDHLAEITAPMLFLQGDRDSLCLLDQLKPVIESISQAQLHVIEGGDHSFKVLKRLKRNQSDVMQELVDQSVNWMQAN